MLQSRGINELLVAEKSAQQTIDEARKAKAKRLKEAQAEAKTEVDRLRKERDDQYKAIEQQVR